MDTTQYGCESLSECQSNVEHLGCSVCDAGASKPDREHRNSSDQERLSYNDLIVPSGHVHTYKHSQIHVHKFENRPQWLMLQALTLKSFEPIRYFDFRNIVLKPLIIP